MKFKNYLIEITRPVHKIAKKTIESGMHEVYRILMKKNWKFNAVMLEDVLNGVYGNKDIVFKVTKERHSSPIISANILWDDHADEFIAILVNLASNIVDFFKKYKKPDTYSEFFDIWNNNFFYQLFGLLSHELIHKYQGISSKGWSFNIELDPESDPIKYISSPTEIEAYAQQAAIDYYKKGMSEILGSYLAATEFDIKDTNADKKLKRKVRNKFLKSFAYYYKKI